MSTPPWVAIEATIIVDRIVRQWPGLWRVWFRYAPEHECRSAMMRNVMEGLSREASRGVKHVPALVDSSAKQSRTG